MRESICINNLLYYFVFLSLVQAICKKIKFLKKYYRLINVIKHKEMFSILMRKISINKKFSESIISAVFVISDAFTVTYYIIRTGTGAKEFICKNYAR